jgi:hypothetical protein
MYGLSEGKLMATYYVGKGGNDASDGTTWAKRKLTLNGAEDIPVAAGDTVYVGPGTYRETLTCDVSGSSGSPITYIGDYDGSHTDGTGGIVRVTASDNDQTTARNYIVKMMGRAYRAFDGFAFDACPKSVYSMFWVETSDVDHLTIRKCTFNGWGGIGIKGFQSANLTNMLVENCIAMNCYNFYIDGEVQDNSGNVIQNCLFFANSGAVIDTKSGGFTIKNCSFYGAYRCVYVSSSLNAGQTVTVNNCVMAGINSFALAAATLGYLVEDYNLCPTRSNVATGAHSLAYGSLLDMRWAHELLNGGSMLSPFDLASYSQLINVAGTSSTTADMRGTTKIGTEREWGALEYDSTLDIEAGSGGAVSIQPIQGSVRL